MSFSIETDATLIARCWNLLFSHAPLSRSRGRPQKKWNNSHWLYSSAEITL